MSLLEKKYQLFISSTFNDLVNARAEIIKVILNMYHIPIGMEMFSADNDEQWATIQETIDNSDYYILLVGHRYGSETAEGISYTEKEFDYAKKKGIPIYSYVRNRDIATLPAERETDAVKAAKLDAFIEKVKSNSMIEFWDDPVDLGQKVSIALSKAFIRRPRVGWVRGDKAASPETLNEIVSLSKENRELKLELENIKVAVKNKPVLKVLFDGEEKIELAVPKSFTTYKSLTRASYEYPEHLYHLAYKYYTVQNVDRFNTWFDQHQEEVEAYNTAIVKSERSKKHKKAIKVSVVNEGTAKANDIHITICFPDGLIISENNEIINEINDLDYPLPVGAPLHPLIAAQNSYSENDKIRATKRQSSDLYKASGFDKLVPRAITINSTFGVTGFKKANIYLKSLLQTRSYDNNEEFEFVLWPANAGKHIAIVEIICEEFTSLQFLEVPVTITEIDQLADK